MFLILAITSLIEHGRRDDDLRFQKFLRYFSEFYEYNKQSLINEYINNKPKYMTNFSQPNITEILDDNNPIEQTRLNFIKNKFDNLNIKNDKEILNNCFKKLKTIRDKVYAHYTDYEKEINIAHSEIEEIINTIISVFNN